MLKLNELSVILIIVTKRGFLAMLTDIKLSLLRGCSADEIYATLSDEDKARLLKWGEDFGKSDLKEQKGRRECS